MQQRPCRGVFYGHQEGIYLGVFARKERTPGIEVNKFRVRITKVAIQAESVFSRHIKHDSNLHATAGTDSCQVYVEAHQQTVVIDKAEPFDFDAYATSRESELNSG